MKSGLYKKLKGYTKEISFNIFLKDLLDFSNFYKAVQSDSKDEITRFFEGFELDLISNNESYIDEITRVFQALKLFKVTQAYPIIYSILVCYKKHIQNMPDQFIKPDKLIALLKAFEKYHFINNMIASRIGNEVEKLYAESAKIFFNSNDFAKLSLDFIEGLREKKATKEEFITHFKEVSYADGMLIHYIFDRINNFSIKGGNIFPLYTPEKGEQKRNFNIEHILPQSEKKSVDQSLVEKIDSIGNLLIVSRHTNSGPLNNKMPIEKFRILEDPQHSGTLKYIKDFIEQYGSNTKWGTDEIDQRAHDLAELGYNTVWNI